MSSLLPLRGRLWVWLAVFAPLCLGMAGCNAQPPVSVEVATPAAPAAPVEVTPVVAAEPRKYLGAVIGNGKPPKPRPKEVFEEAREDTVLLQFTTTWCRPSREMQPIIDELIAEGYPIRQYDADQRRKFADTHEVDSIPTFILFVRGAEVHRSVGATSHSDLVKMFRKYRIRPVKPGAS